MRMNWGQGHGEESAARVHPDIKGPVLPTSIHLNHGTLITFTRRQAHLAELTVIFGEYLPIFPCKSDAGKHAGL